MTEWCSWCWCVKVFEDVGNLLVPFINVEIYPVMGTLGLGFQFYPVVFVEHLVNRAYGHYEGNVSLGASSLQCVRSSDSEHVTLPSDPARKTVCMNSCS